MPLRGFRVLPESVADWDRFFRDVPVAPDPASVGQTELKVNAVATANIQDLAVNTLKLAADAVTDAKLRNSSALSVIGRASNTNGDPADILASATNTFLSRRGTALVFDPLLDSDIPGTIARDTEVTAAITAHEGAADPHPTYTTAAELTTALNALNLASGVYTPTLTNVANLDGSTAFECQYLRVGSVVTVSGKVSVDPTTTATSTQLGISLPIASNLGAEEDCAGTAFASAIASQGAAIKADATNNRAQMQWIAGDVTNQLLFFSFTYQVI